MLFEIYINPKFNNLNKIKTHLNSFFRFKSFLDRYNIIIYTKYSSLQFDLKKFSKFKIHFITIEENITSLRQLWTQNIQIYNNVNWVIHYNIQDELIEFDFIKMIFKNMKNTFVKKDFHNIYENLFCIHTHLLNNFITSNNNHLTPIFIMRNTYYYYFLKYMNIISTNSKGENIYI